MQYVPSIIFLVVVGICVALNLYYHLAFYVFGTYNAWFYLRFFQQQPDSQAYGDASDDFKFSSFFPEFMAPPVDAIGSILAFVFRLKHAPATDAKPLHASNAPSMLGSDAADANRRR